MKEENFKGGSKAKFPQSLMMDMSRSYMNRQDRINAMNLYIQKSSYNPQFLQEEEEEEDESESETLGDIILRTLTIIFPDFSPWLWFLIHFVMNLVVVCISLSSLSEPNIHDYLIEPKYNRVFIFGSIYSCFVILCINIASFSIVMIIHAIVQKVILEKLLQPSALCAAFYNTVDPELIYLLWSSVQIIYWRSNMILKKGQNENGDYYILRIWGYKDEENSFKFLSTIHWHITFPILLYIVFAARSLFLSIISFIFELGFLMNAHDLLVKYLRKYGILRKFNIEWFMFIADKQENIRSLFGYELYQDERIMRQLETNLISKKFIQDKAELLLFKNLPKNCTCCKISMNRNKKNTMKLLLPPVFDAKNIIKSETSSIKNWLACHYVVNTPPLLFLLNSSISLTNKNAVKNGGDILFRQIIMSLKMYYQEKNDTYAFTGSPMHNISSDDMSPNKNMLSLNLNKESTVLPFQGSFPYSSKEPLNKADSESRAQKKINLENIFNDIDQDLLREGTDGGDAAGGDVDGREAYGGDVDGRDAYGGGANRGGANRGGANGGGANGGGANGGGAQGEKLPRAQSRPRAKARSRQRAKKGSRSVSHINQNVRDNVGETNPSDEEIIRQKKKKKNSVVRGKEELPDVTSGRGDILEIEANGSFRALSGLPSEKSFSPLAARENQKEQRHTQKQERSSHKADATGERKRSTRRSVGDGEKYNQGVDAGTIRRETTAGAIQRETTTGAIQRETMTGAIRRETTTGTNERAALEGSNMREASAGSNMREASAGSNMREASAGSNMREASAGSNAREASAGADERAAGVGGILVGADGRGDTMMESTKFNICITPSLSGIQNAQGKTQHSENKQSGNGYDDKAVVSENYDIDIHAKEEGNFYPPLENYKSMTVQIKDFSIEDVLQKKYTTDSMHNSEMRMQEGVSDIGNPNTTRGENWNSTMSSEDKETEKEKVILRDQSMLGMPLLQENDATEKQRAIFSNTYNLLGGQQRESNVSEAVYGSFQMYGADQRTRHQNEENEKGKSGESGRNGRSGRIGINGRMGRSERSERSERSGNYGKSRHDSRGSRGERRSGSAGKVAEGYDSRVMNEEMNILERSDAINVKRLKENKRMRFRNCICWRKNKKEERFSRIKKDISLEIDDPFVMNLKSPIQLNINGNEYITKEMIEVFLKPEETEDFMKEFDLSGHGKIDIIMFRNAVKRAITCRKKFIKSLKGQESILKLVRRLMSVLMSFLASVVLLFIFGVSADTIIVTGAAFITAITVILSYMYTSFITSVIFIAFSNPYNIGDRIRLDGGEAMYIKKIKTYTTEFETTTGKIVIYENSKLSNAKIYNESRSKNAYIDISFKVDINTPLLALKELRKSLQFLVDSRPSDFCKTKNLYFGYSLQPGYFYEISFWIKCVEGWGNWRKVFELRTDIYDFIILQLRLLSISYRLPTQKVGFTAPLNIIDNSNLKFNGRNKPGEYPCPPKEIRNPLFLPSAKHKREFDLCDQKIDTLALPQKSDYHMYHHNNIGDDNDVDSCNAYSTAMPVPMPRRGNYRHLLIERNNLLGEIPKERKRSGFLQKRKKGYITKCDNRNNPKMDTKWMINPSRSISTRGDLRPNGNFTMYTEKCKNEYISPGSNNFDIFSDDKNFLSLCGKKLRTGKIFYTENELQKGEYSYNNKCDEMFTHSSSIPHVDLALGEIPHEYGSSKIGFKHLEGESAHDTKIRNSDGDFLMEEALPSGQMQRCRWCKTDHDIRECANMCCAKDDCSFHRDKRSPFDVFHNCEYVEPMWYNEKDDFSYDSSSGYDSFECVKHFSNLHNRHQKFINIKKTSTIMDKKNYNKKNQ
ncbi:mechanosensitive ion channel protein, putative [Plasmodium ovale]|uniref:Mechanosensitive ion channel protein, putative n=1 Tax=Plasmodium ovale TaxID=36330 RepID=A0A1C3KSC6_PLAOA|nr:mechanosensitive ion channel protein, putative [Plasmodium ovale]